nr:SWIM zinc finger family protein [Paenibacillus hamazuiensis]
MEDLVYRAEVEGSEIYEVYVELDEEGNVISSDCDCPFDYENFCKHQAAVLLELRDRAGMPTAALAEGTTSKNLRQLLEAESKESLIDLLLSLADSGSVRQRIKLHVSKAGGADELEECRKLIRSYIDTYSDHHGFVDWRSADQAVEGAKIVAGKAEEAAEQEEWVRAVRIYLCILEEMVEFLQEADDSGGTTGCLIEESLQCIDEIVEQRNRMPQADKATLFGLLLDESERPGYDGWSDWQLALLDSAARLAETAEMRRTWEEAASRMVSEQADDFRGRNYFAERIAVMQYRLIQDNEPKKHVDDFLNRHLHFSNFREMAIQDAFQKSDYNEVIRLAEEGEAQDQAKGLPGLVYRWSKHRYEAYQRSGQLELQRQLGVRFVLDGEFSYYKQLKDTYPPEEWKPVYRSMLEELEKDRWPKEVYTDILVEEQEFSRLLDHVKAQPSRIEQFYPHLNPHFPDEVKKLFHIHIEGQAAQSTTRKHYADVCRIILMLGRA